MRETVAQASCRWGKRASCPLFLGGDRRDAYLLHRRDGRAPTTHDNLRGVAYDRRVNLFNH